MYSVKFVADLLKVTTQSVRNLIKEGSLSKTKFTTGISAATLVAYLVKYGKYGNGLDPKNLEILLQDCDSQAISRPPFPRIDDVDDLIMYIKSHSFQEAKVYLTNNKKSV